jgi:hypothetical protein
MYKCVKGFFSGEKTYYSKELYTSMPKGFEHYFVEVKEEKKVEKPAKVHTRKVKSK